MRLGYIWDFFYLFRTGNIRNTVNININTTFVYVCEFSHRLPWKLGSVWNYALKDLVLPCYRLWELIVNMKKLFLSNFVMHISLQEKQSLKRGQLL